MRVLVDTSVWSLALRRAGPARHPSVIELGELIREGRTAIVGPVRQEILSGVRHRADFERLQDHLRAFPDVPLVTADYERAAECFNRCRARGVQGSNTDFLLCAVAERNNFAILTTDRDFDVFAKILPVTLHRPRTRAAPR